MANMLTEMLADSFVWDAINTNIRNTRRGSNGATMINCPMCIFNGHRPDRRHRCGITRQANGCLIHCYNCDFRTKYQSGENIMPKMKAFLEAIGVSHTNVQRIALKAMQYRRMVGSNPEAQSLVQISHSPNFPKMSLPHDSFTLKQWADKGLEDTDFIEVAEYLFSRGESIVNASEYFWSPNKEHNFNRRIIIPFYHQKNIIGYTGRLIDQSSSEKPKYWTRVPAHYIFNNDKLNLDRKYIFVTEGPFDALAVDGVSPLGSKLSPEQALWLSTSDKIKIVLADRDASGQRLIDHALAHDWMVAFPKLADGHGFKNWWDADVKDAAQASERYGKLYTVRSIIESATKNKIEIGVKRKLLYKK